NIQEQVSPGSWRYSDQATSGTLGPPHLLPGTDSDFAACSFLSLYGDFSIFHFLYRKTTIIVMKTCLHRVHWEKEGDQDIDLSAPSPAPCLPGCWQASHHDDDGLHL
ncbi:mCG140546, partial [Mus musculus]